MNEVLEPGAEMLGAVLEVAGGRGLALDRRGDGEYVGWAVYATAEFDDGEPERLRDVTAAEAVDLAPQGRGLIVTATLDAIAVLRLPDGAGRPAGEAVANQAERLVDELVAVGLSRETVLSLAHRLSRAHVVAREVRSHPARESSEHEPRFDRAEQPHALSMRAPRRRWPSLPPRRLAAAAAAGAVVLAAVVALLILRPTDGSGSKRRSASAERSSSVSTSTRMPPAQQAPTGQPTRPPTVSLNLSAIGAWDPYGDGREHDTKASAAEDGNSGTYWPTETYVDGLQKPGVGLLLDTGRSVQLRRLIVTTDTPGYSALIEVGSAPAGPFRPISAARTVASTTTFSLRARAGRYYVIWITRLDHNAHVNEVRAFGLSAKT